MPYAVQRDARMQQFQYFFMFIFNLQDEEKYLCFIIKCVLNFDEMKCVRFWSMLVRFHLGNFNGIKLFDA